MEFVVKDKPALKEYKAEEVIDLVAGKHYKIETFPAGSEILDYLVPVGKSAIITTFVRIEETDI